VPDWEYPDTVVFFREREPDVGLVGLVESGALPAGARALDLGCAAGRNAVYLAERGVPAVAVDTSAAMVATTSARLASFARSAPWRVLRRSMSSLDDQTTGPFALLLALDVLQNAPNEVVFWRALSHLARLAAPDARLMLQNFGPDSRPRGEPLRRVDATRHVWHAPSKV
jgi:SAM-dependent methyltransferase